jgi:hypothetical protein
MISPIKTILTASLLTLTTLTSVVKAQGDLSALNNITSLTGTWSSGSGGVQTGGVSSDCHLLFGLLFCRGLGWVGEFMGYLDMRIDDDSTRPDHYHPRHFVIWSTITTNLPTPFTALLRHRIEVDRGSRADDDDDIQGVV